MRARSFDAANFRGKRQISLSAARGEKRLRLDAADERRLARALGSAGSQRRYSIPAVRSSAHRGDTRSRGRRQPARAPKTPRTLGPQNDAALCSPQQTAPRGSAAPDRKAPGREGDCGSRDAKRRGDGPMTALFIGGTFVGTPQTTRHNSVQLPTCGTRAEILSIQDVGGVSDEDRELNCRLPETIWNLHVLPRIVRCPASTDSSHSQTKPRAVFPPLKGASRTRPSGSCSRSSSGLARAERVPNGKRNGGSHGKKRGHGGEGEVVGGTGKPSL